MCNIALAINGWSSHVGIYGDLCKSEPAVPYKPCKEQDLRMNYMFTLSTVVTNASALPIGMLLDYIGPQYTTLLGALVFMLGNIVFPLDIRNHYVDTYFIGFILLAIGGPLIFLPSFHLSNAFPIKAGLILSCVTGAFDASSIPYLLYDVLDAKVGEISLKTFFWAYSIIPALLIVYQVTIGPTISYKREDFHERAGTDDTLVDDPTTPTAVGTPSPDFANLEDGTSKGEVRDRVVGVMFGKSAAEQIRSMWFGAIVIFLCVYMSRINYYIQTVFSQLYFYLHDIELARSVTMTFTVLLPLGGLVGVPFVGWLLDHRTTLEASLVVLVSGVLFGVLGMVRHVAPQIISIGIFVVLRPLMYTFVGDYCGKVFGFETFGTVYGLTNSISGLFGLVLRPIDVLVKTKLDGDYVPIDVLGIILGILSSSLLSWQIWKGTRPIALD
ncbi:hypothetical protein FRC02_003966 [Tulasnella sp. 418]|nr:hypothetical protein FRC02_003966 [Tulasnella sp. 418]